MKSVLIDDSLQLPEESEARREHERYLCENLTAEYRQLIPGNSAQQPALNARVNDISLKGLAIETSQHLNMGDILSLEMNTPAAEHDNEVLTAVIMWCKTANGEQFQAGLRIIPAQMLSSEPANDHHSQPSLSQQHQLLCPSCHETSFFLREINSDQQTPDIYHCCRCNHSHPITEVMAFNRHIV